jgi:hypothetical protein
MAEIPLHEAKARAQALQSVYQKCGTCGRTYEPRFVLIAQTPSGPEGVGLYPARCPHCNAPGLIVGSPVVIPGRVKPS